jgi:hypothetical protein
MLISEKKKPCGFSEIIPRDYIPFLGLLSSGLPTSPSHCYLQTQLETSDSFIPRPIILSE